MIAMLVSGFDEWSFDTDQITQKLLLYFIKLFFVHSVCFLMGFKAVI